MNNPKNIHNSKDIEQEKMLNYLNGNMSDAEQHDFEKNINEDDFMLDAVEGLEGLKSNIELPYIVQELNKGLKQQIDQKKKRKDKRKIKEQPWIYFSILLILLLAVVAYLVIRRF